MVNISSLYLIQKEEFILALINKKIYLIQILVIYYHTSIENNYLYIEESVNEINLIIQSTLYKCTLYKCILFISAPFYLVLSWDLYAKCTFYIYIFL